MVPDAGGDWSPLIALAREALTAGLGGAARSDVAPDGLARARRGAFVTLRNAGMLRGCVGRIEADRPLVELVPEIAVAAALEDTRFPPVTLGELAEIRVEVSVLAPPTRLDPVEPAALVIGRHGLILRLGTTTGVLLPQVAVEHGFDAEEFLDAVSSKAGLDAGAWRNPDAEVLVFETEVVAE